MRVIKMSPKDWADLSENAHLVVFGKKKPCEWDRIDYALITVDESQTLLTYITVRETDAKTVYWQFGGAFPSSKGTVKTYACFQACLAWAKALYERVSMLIENNNTAMLKFAMKAGFRIMGVRNFKGSILLEHCLEFQGG